MKKGIGGLTPERLEMSVTLGVMPNIAPKCDVVYFTGWGQIMLLLRDGMITRIVNLYAVTLKNGIMSTF